MSQKFFPTEHFEDRPNTTHQRNRSLRANQSSFHRIKYLKKEIHQMENEYKRALSELNHTQSSISKSNRQAQKTKVSFLKLYEKKKIKLQNKAKVQNKKLQDKERLKTVSKDTKQKKLLNELELLATKQEVEQVNQVRTERFKKQKQAIKDQVRVQNNNFYIKAREKYLQAKESKTQLLDRKQKIEQFLLQQARQNYFSKMGKELEAINAYDGFLSNLKASRPKQQVRPATSMSRSFFITTKKLDGFSVMKESRQDGFDISAR